MNRIILADDQAIFRAGAARVLALEEDMRIVAQCDEQARLLAAIEAHSGAIVIFSSTLVKDLGVVAACVREARSLGILVGEKGLELTGESSSLLAGLLNRTASGAELIDMVRRVARGQKCVQLTPAATEQAHDAVGARVRDRLTPKEMQIVALIVQGCKNKDIAARLGTKEQVIKNYLRNIYDKIGVSDRLELALFTLHHRVLAEAASKAGTLLQLRTA